MNANEHACWLIALMMVSSWAVMIVVYWFCCLDHRIRHSCSENNNSSILARGSDLDRSSSVRDPITIPAGESLHIYPLSGRLKTWIEYFQVQWDGLKSFELRIEDDKRFEAGQIWLLEEYQPDYTMIDSKTGVSKWAKTGTYSGRKIYVKIKYVMKGGCFGLKPGWSIFSFDILARVESPGIESHPVPIES